MPCNLSKSFTPLADLAKRCLKKPNDRIAVEFHYTLAIILFQIPLSSFRRRLPCVYSNVIFFKLEALPLVLVFHTLSSLLPKEQSLAMKMNRANSYFIFNPDRTDLRDGFVATKDTKGGRQGWLGCRWR